MLTLSYVLASYQNLSFKQKKKPKHIYWQNFLTKEPNMYKGEKKIFSINGAGKSWKAICKRIKVDCCLSSFTKFIQNGSKT